MAVTDIDVARIVAGFEDRTLPKREWSHQAHLVVGLTYVVRYGPGAAMELLRDRISAYNEATGVENTETDGYHETITRCYVEGLAGWLRHRPPESPDERFSALLESDVADPIYPLRFYPREVLFSPGARLSYVPPIFPSGRLDPAG
jgi:hypothetical protein